MLRGNLCISGPKDVAKAYQPSMISKSLSQDTFAGEHSGFKAGSLSAFCSETGNAKQGTIQPCQLRPLGTALCPFTSSPWNWGPGISCVQLSIKPFQRSKNMPKQLDDSCHFKKVRCLKMQDFSSLEVSD